VLEQDSLTIGHVGDCRLYRLRNSSIELLTRDHTKAHDLLHLHHISQEQLSQHPGRHQHTRSIGNDIFVKTDIIREKMLPGDTYLLCSDGVWSTLTREQIQETMQQNTIHSACEQLVMSALQSGGPDNITAIVFRIEMIGSCAAPPFSLRKFILKR
jgi:protein phosphatase